MLECPTLERSGTHLRTGVFCYWSAGALRGVLAQALGVAPPCVPLTISMEQQAAEIFCGRLRVVRG